MGREREREREIAREKKKMNAWVGMHRVGPVQRIARRDGQRWLPAAQPLDGLRTDICLTEMNVRIKRFNKKKILISPWRLFRGFGAKERVYDKNLHLSKNNLVIKIEAFIRVRDLVKPRHRGWTPRKHPAGRRMI